MNKISVHVMTKLSWSHLCHMWQGKYPSKATWKEVFKSPKKSLEGVFISQKNLRQVLDAQRFFSMCAWKLPQKATIFFWKRKVLQFRTMWSRLPCGGSVHILNKPVVSPSIFTPKISVRSLKFKFGRPMNGPTRTLVQLGEKSTTYWESAWICTTWDV